MILILGGTSEGYSLAKRFIVEEEDFVMTVATRYGYDLYFQDLGDRVIQICFDTEGLIEFLKKHRVTKVIDCTHPFAQTIKAVATAGCKSIGVEYVPAYRKPDNAIGYDRVKIVDGFENIIETLRNIGSKRPLFTTGSNNLSFLDSIDCEDIFVRVLPYEQSIRKCIDAGIKRQNIIAMQGPFSTELNLALINQYRIDSLITKNSSDAGGLREKISACSIAGIWMIVINPPD